MAKVPQKKSSGGWFFTASIAVVIIAAAFGLMYLTSDQKTPQPSRLAPAPIPATEQPLQTGLAGTKVRLEKLTRAWLTNRPDKWLIDAELQDGIRMQEQFDLIYRIRSQIFLALDRNRKLPAVKELDKRFGHNFNVTIFNASLGASRVVSKGPMTENQATWQEVTLFSRAALRHPKINDQILFFDQSWHSLFIAGIEWADWSWFDAAFLHELYHAEKFQTHKASATAPAWSDLWISEEAGAHMLEAEVLNLRTQGKLEVQLRSRVRGDTLEEFLNSLQPEDIDSVDRLFAPAGENEAGERITQYQLMFAETWLRQHGFQGLQLTEALTHAYKYLFMAS